MPVTQTEELSLTTRGISTFPYPSYLFPKFQVYWPPHVWQSPTYLYLSQPDRDIDSFWDKVPLRHSNPTLIYCLTSRPYLYLCPQLQESVLITNNSLDIYVLMTSQRRRGEDFCILEEFRVSWIFSKWLSLAYFLKLPLTSF